MQSRKIKLGIGLGYRLSKTLTQHPVPYYTSFSKAIQSKPPQTAPPSLDSVFKAYEPIYDIYHLNQDTVWSGKIFSEPMYPCLGGMFICCMFPYVFVLVWWKLHQCLRMSLRLLFESQFSFIFVYNKCKYPMEL